MKDELKRTEESYEKEIKDKDLENFWLRICLFSMAFVCLIQGLMLHVK